jgi:hypothetical protein
MRQAMTVPFRTLAAELLAALVVTACAGGGAVPGSDSGAGAGSPPGSVSVSPAVSAGPRPSSPAVIAITQPASGAVVTSSAVHVVISLQGAQIVSATTTNIRPDQGHVHLYVDNVLVSMNYGLEQDIPVKPGTYVLKAEFVASDHAPFNPRVWSQQVFFTVK